MGKLGLAWQIVLLIGASAALLTLGTLLKTPPEIVSSIALSLPGGIIALVKAAAIRVPRE